MKSQNNMCHLNLFWNLITLPWNEIWLLQTSIHKNKPAGQPLPTWKELPTKLMKNSLVRYRHYR